MKIKIHYPTGREEVIDVKSGEQGFINIMTDMGDDNFHEELNITMSVIDGEIIGHKYMGVDQGEEYHEWGKF